MFLIANCLIFITCRRDDYGRIKINISSVWKNTYLVRLGSNCNVCINLVESDEDGDIYFFDV